MTKERVTTTFQPPKPLTEGTASPQIIPVTDPEALSRMSRSELEHAYRIACGAFLGVALASDEETGEAILLELAAGARNKADRKGARECAKLWMDRKLGSVVQKSAIMPKNAPNDDSHMTFVQILESLDGKSTGLPEGFDDE